MEFLHLFCQVPQADPIGIPGWVYAQGGIAAVCMVGLFALLKQMMSTFGDKVDKLLVTFKEEQTSQRTLDAQKVDKILVAFKEDQAVERKRADDSIERERSRADLERTRFWQEMANLKTAFQEARCKVPVNDGELRMFISSLQKHVQLLERRDQDRRDQENRG